MTETVVPTCRALRVATFIACVLFALVVLWYLHDRQWNSYDDGAYLHVADRILHGEVLNRDVQDVHAGYVNFANAGAMWLFGNDAVSPRYPLVAMGVVNAAVAFWLLSPYGTLAAVAASAAATCLSCAQFMNPTAHWYALFLTLLTLVVMVRRPPGAASTQLVLGLMVGLVFLFRQLTGVFVGAGVLLFLLVHLPQEGRGRQAWMGRGFVALMALVLGVYFVKNVDVVAGLMYCTWPLLLLAWGVWNCRAATKDVARMLAVFTAGFFTAAVPLVAYHVYHGSVHAWLDDAFFGALSLTALPFIDQYRYWRDVVGGAKAVVRPRDAVRALTGLFWVAALGLPVLHGVLAARTLWRRPATSEETLTPTLSRSTGRGGKSGRFLYPAVSSPALPAALGPLPLMAAFYFPVALHLQKYMYFFFAAPVLVIGLLAIAPAARGMRSVVAAGVCALSLLALVCLSGGTLRPGYRIRLTKDHGVPRCGIRLEEDVGMAYREILALTDRETGKDDAIFAVPVHPELYYLTGRRNPTRFYNSALALHSAAETRALLDAFERSPPRLVFYDPESHYNTAESGRIMEWVRGRYEPLGTVGGFTVYRARG